MVIRQAVADFSRQGHCLTKTNPPRQSRRQRDLLCRIETPVTDVEATALPGGLGPDNCYGLAWASCT